MQHFLEKYGGPQKSKGHVLQADVSRSQNIARVYIPNNTLAGITSIHNEQLALLEQAPGIKIAYISNNLHIF